jgi:hypothetical protein
MYIRTVNTSRKISGERVSDNPDNLIADLTTPGVVVAYYLSDGSSARARYPAGTIEDVETTLSVAKRTGKLIQVDSIDTLKGENMDTYIVPSAVIAVRVERAAAGDLLGAVAWEGSPP